MKFERRPIPMKENELSINHFGEIKYLSCFFSAFFPIVLNTVGTLLPFMTNNIYTYTKRNNYLHFDCINISDIESISSSIGLSKKNISFDNNTIKNIIKEIDFNHPVISFVDSFYENIRADTYKKKHLSHAILIYGYNNANKNFKIFEHDNMNSFYYTENVIDYAAFIDCITGYMNNYNEQKRSFIFSYSYKKQHIDFNSFYINYLINSIKYENLYYDGLNFIPEYCNTLIEIYRNPNSVKLKDTIYHMSDSIAKKTMYKFNIGQIFGNKVDDILPIIDDITNSWNLIRSILVKMQLTNTLVTRHIDIIDHNISKIYKYELIASEYIFDLIHSEKRRLIT